MDAVLTSAMLTDLLKSLALLGLFLIIGTILRAKVSLFQRLFLPANVIGGSFSAPSASPFWASSVFPLSGSATTT